MNWVDQIETHLSDDVPRHIEVFDPKKTDFGKESPQECTPYFSWSLMTNCGGISRALLSGPLKLWLWMSVIKLKTEH